MLKSNDLEAEEEEWYEIKYATMMEEFHKDMVSLFIFHERTTLEIDTLDDEDKDKINQLLRKINNKGRLYFR